MINPRVLFGVLLMGSSAFAQTDASEVHEKVQAALDWQLPHNACEKPQLLGETADVVDTDGVRVRLDVDSYQLDRFERKQKRWQTCIEKYKRALFADFEDLNNSAQYGLSRQQANVILGKMALIQTVLESPNAVVEAPSPPP